jgi:Rad3-related DNA helicase
MKRLQFNSQGRLAAVDSSLDADFYEQSQPLRTAASLSNIFEGQILDSSKDSKYWSLYAGDKRLEPLKFSNEKTQENVVEEVVGHINHGKKVIFIHGVCGTGKSAIALNIARALGRASLVVPVKALQKQYEDDYAGGKYLLKPDGRKMKISMITGRENHDSVIFPGVSCADPSLPDTIALVEKNFEKLAEYYKENPVILHKMELDNVSKLKRISIAPANPYWSPIVPAEFELPLKDAKKKRYTGLSGREFIFYHRKRGCSYYDQYEAYIHSDVLIFNAAKYKIEVALDRKPATTVDIIDESDEFLDSFSVQHDLNLTRLAHSLKSLYPEEGPAQEAVNKIITFLGIEDKRIQAIGINESIIHALTETNVHAVLRNLVDCKELQAEAAIDDSSYVSKAIEIAKQFSEAFDETYLSYRKEDKDVIVTLVTTNVARRFKELSEKCSSLVLMSGTLHSKEVISKVFGIEDYVIVDAETQHQGTLEIQRTGREMDCKYSNFASGRHTRDEYYSALDICLQKAKKPVLVHVNSFEDLPSESDISNKGFSSLMPRETLRKNQSEDKQGKDIRRFKQKQISELFSTKCSRGVDFPGNICNSVVFTKYPNPDISGTFWKILQKTHPEAFWDFYRDKARREFLQRVYRALRSKEDHVFILSPDKRVLDAAMAFQRDELG